MSGQRDRDVYGRARNARPRDELGRPLPRGAAGVAEDPEVARLTATGDPAELLAGAQALLDAGRPFEAHELLEAGWKRAPAGERQLWRTLAQLAVGLTHRLRGNDAGANALAARAAAALEALREDPASAVSAAAHGIDLAGLAVSARMLASGRQTPLQLLRN